MLIKLNKMRLTQKMVRNVWLGPFKEHSLTLWSSNYPRSWCTVAISWPSPLDWQYGLVIFQERTLAVLPELVHIGWRPAGANQYYRRIGVGDAFKRCSGSLGEDASCAVAEVSTWWIFAKRYGHQWCWAGWRPWVLPSCQIWEMAWRRCCATPKIEWRAPRLGSVASSIPGSQILPLTMLAGALSFSVYF
jgi:hypothetical protein